MPKRAKSYEKLTPDEKEHAGLLAQNMTTQWLASSLAIELFDQEISKAARQLLLALCVKTR